MPTFAIVNHLGDVYTWDSVVFNSNTTLKKFYPSTVSIYRNKTPRNLVIEKDGIMYDVGNLIAIKTIIYHHSAAEITGLHLASDLQGTIPAALLFAARPGQNDASTGYSCVVMPYCKTTLFRRIQHAPLDCLLQYFCTIVKVVSHLFLFGAFYADLKLTNIMVSSNQLIFIDFGSIAPTDSNDGIATYPPASSPSGVGISCSESNLIEILGNLFVSLYLPEYEEKLRFGSANIVAGRQAILAETTLNTHTLLDYCWGDHSKTFHGLFNEIQRLAS